MRITFVLPPVDMSGGIRVTSVHAENLRRRGHQVLAISVRSPRPPLGESIRSLAKGVWPRREPDLPSHFDGLPVEHRRLGHAGPITDKDVPDADVIIGTWWQTVDWVSRLSPRKGAKVHFVQGYDACAAPRQKVDRVYALPIQKIVISGWLRELVRSRFQQEPLAVVPNSVDRAAFATPPRCKQPVPTVGMMYSNLAVKGVDIMLKAFDLASGKLPGLRLVCMSNVPVEPELALPEGAEFIYQARGTQVRDAYARCDVWLSGTREEGFGLPILEAMASRTPVIATPAGAAPELLANGGGILVPHEDPAAMAKAICAVCSLGDGEWRALSDNALASATGYSWEEATDLFEKGLLEVAAKPVRMA